MEQLQAEQFEKPNYTEWLKSLKAKAVEAERLEKEELQWQKRYGKS